MIRPENFNPMRWFIVLVMVAFACSNAAAAVIMQDNFDNPSPSDWNSSDSYYSPWNGKASDSTSNCVGVVKHAGSIESPGRGGSGKSLRLNRCNGFYTEGYYGYYNYTNADSSIKKLYARWYWRLPSATDAYLGDAQYLKLTRWNMGSGSEVYVNFNFGGNLRNSELMVYPQLNGADFANQPSQTWYGTGRTFGSIADGKWHAFEMMLDISSSTVQMQIWLDGSSVWTFSENLSPYSGTYIKNCLTPGIGNMASNSFWDFPTSGWYALEFDDYVLSTTYVGTSGPADSPLKMTGTPSNLMIK
jgi:hypothetical protein